MSKRKRKRKPALMYPLSTKRLTAYIVKLEKNNNEFLRQIPKKQRLTTMVSHYVSAMANWHICLHELLELRAEISRNKP